MRARRSLLLLVAPAALAACGGEPQTRAERTADCLNEQGYLVTAAADSVAGTSPNGVGFVVSVTLEEATIDDSGNPPASESEEPAKLSEAEREQIEDCAA